jgi:electron transfer flavoprotein alpha subunit
MQGIGQCDKVVTINTDAGCDMVKRADLSTIGDAETVLAELVSLVDTYRQQASHNHNGDKEGAKDAA